MFYGCETNPMNQPIEEKCGYCRKVQKNRGGNRGYQCARHRKRVTMKSVKFYTQEHIENLLEQERKRMSDEIEGLHKRSAEFEDFSSATVDEVLSIINK